MMAVLVSLYFAIGGILGTLATGFFAVDSIGDHDGVFYSSGSSGWILFGKQIYGVVVTIVWSAFASYVILIIIDKTIGLKVKMDTTSDDARKIKFFDVTVNCDQNASASDLEIDSSYNSISNESIDARAPQPIPMVIDIGSIDILSNHSVAEHSSLGELSLDEPHEEIPTRDNYDVIVAATQGVESAEIYVM